MKNFRYENLRFPDTMIFRMESNYSRKTCLDVSEFGFLNKKFTSEKIRTMFWRICDSRKTYEDGEMVYGNERRYWIDDHPYMVGGDKIPSLLY